MAKTTGFEDSDDLATLAELDEDILLKKLKERFNSNKIYTYVGDILVSVNPYKDLGIYGAEASDMYRMVKRGDHPPHIFGVADTAYQDMLGLRGFEATNQCILISGESGAGKTESTKHIIKHLVTLSKGSSQLEQQVIQVNPLLEAFGNAQTLMNDNSSRFGRYIQLKFLNGRVVGSKISEYLLEKSRVVQQNYGEENFHIMYYIFAGMDESRRNVLHLKDPQRYNYFSYGAECLTTHHASLKERYDELLNAMDMVGFTDEEQQDMFTILAAILNLGNASFVNSEDGECSVTSETTDFVNNASTHLGIVPGEMSGVLTASVTYTRGEEVRRNYTVQQAVESRDAVSKTLYGRLFSWIIHKINTLLAISGKSSAQEELQEIGILDIFGFEHFEHNSFEQACINLANEQLQFFFNQYVFTLEQEEYRREGINWQEIKFVDNQALLDLFVAKPVGLLNLLDEETHFPQGTDLSFVEKMNSKFDGNANYVKSKKGHSTMFTISHYAGKVTYDALGWLDKNRDTLPPGCMEMLQQADNTLLKHIFLGKISRTGTLAFQNRTSKRTTQRKAQKAFKDARERKLTVGAQFKNSLHVLMTRMRLSKPVFVRCIKPNEVKAEGQFNQEHVQAQLLYTGMLQTTKIRREGYAVRPAWAEFTERYKFILYQTVLEPTAGNCKKILESTGIAGWQVGKTRVFLKYDHIDTLNDKLQIISRKAVDIQKVVRGFLGRRRAAHVRAKAREEKEKLKRMLAEAEQRIIAAELKLRQLSTEDKEAHAAFQAVKSVRVQDLPPPPAFTPPTPISESFRAPMPIPGGRQTQGSGFADDGSDSDGVLEDEFVPLTTKDRFGKEGTRAASVRWFKETQVKSVKNKDGQFERWFHGIITRKQSEELLKDLPVGYFLIRVSESRFGYTLSFKAEDRVRHYMLDQLHNNKYVVIGEPRVHRTLHELVAHHQKIPLSNWPRQLTHPCGQEYGECDYFELLDKVEYNNAKEMMNQPDSGSEFRDSTNSMASSVASSVAGPPIPDRGYRVTDVKGPRDSKAQYNPQPLPSKGPKRLSRAPPPPSSGITRLRQAEKM